MSERAVLEQRLATLGGLLAKPGGPLGKSAGSLGQNLVAGWSAEKRLLSRILDDCSASDVRSVIDTWLERTTAFVAASQDQAPSWTDKQGQTWDARQVLALLAETKERLDAWSGASEAPAALDGRR